MYHMSCTEIRSASFSGLEQIFIFVNFESKTAVQDAHARSGLDKQVHEHIFGPRLYTLACFHL